MEAKLAEAKNKQKLDAHNKKTATVHKAKERRDKSAAAKKAQARRRKKN